MRLETFLGLKLRSTFKFALFPNRMLSARPGEEAPLSSGLPTIAFNISKKEQFTPTNGFKNLLRRLRGQFKVIMYMGIKADTLDSKTKSRRPR